MPEKPNVEIILERLKQNTKLTKEVKETVEEGFKVLDQRINSNAKKIYALQLYRENDQQNLKDARAEAKRILEVAAGQAKAKIDDNTKPAVGSSRWLLATLVTIILALIGALGVSR